MALLLPFRNTERAMIPSNEDRESAEDLFC